MAFRRRRCRSACHLLSSPSRSSAADMAQTLIRQKPASLCRLEATCFAGWLTPLLSGVGCCGDALDVRCTPHQEAVCGCFAGCAWRGLGTAAEPPQAACAGAAGTRPAGSIRFPAPALRLQCRQQKCMSSAELGAGRTSCMRCDITCCVADCVWRKCHNPGRNGCRRRQGRRAGRGRLVRRLPERAAQPGGHARALRAHHAGAHRPERDGALAYICATAVRK